MKTYLFVVPTAFRTGSVLRTDIYRSLQPGSRIVIASPFANDEAFQKEFPGIHVPLAKLPVPVIRRIARLRDIFLAIDKPYFIRARTIERSIVSHRQFTGLSGKEKFLRVIGILARPFRFLFLFLFDRIEEALLPPPAYRKLMREYAPNAVILGTLSEPEDIVWLALARQSHVPAFAVDLPWSYMETRFFAVPRKAHIMMWNKKMKDEFLSLYPHPENLLHITGTQRYDFFKEKFPTMEKEGFYKAIGADPQKRLIVYFVVSDFWHPHQADVAKVILEAIESDALAKDTQVLLRFGWKQEINKDYQSLAKKYPNLIIQKAEDMPHQDYPAHLIQYADVSLSVSSSLALDAAVLDKPHIFTGLAGENTPPTAAGIKSIYDYEFMKQAIGTGGAPVSYDAKQFISLIGEYMENPGKDAEGRKKLVRLFLTDIGNAGKKIAEVIRGA